MLNKLNYELVSSVCFSFGFERDLSRRRQKSREHNKIHRRKHVNTSRKLASNCVSFFVPNCELQVKIEPPLSFDYDRLSLHRYSASTTTPIRQLQSRSEDTFWSTLKPSDSCTCKCRPLSDFRSFWNPKIIVVVHIKCSISYLMGIVRTGPYQGFDICRIGSRASVGRKSWEINRGFLKKDSRTKTKLTLVYAPLSSERWMR